MSYQDNIPYGLKMFNQNSPHIYTFWQKDIYKLITWFSKTETEQVVSDDFPLMGVKGSLMLPILASYGPSCHNTFSFQPAFYGRLSLSNVVSLLNTKFSYGVSVPLSPHMLTFFEVTSAFIMSDISYHVHLVQDDAQNSAGSCKSHKPWLIRKQNAIKWWKNPSWKITYVQKTWKPTNQPILLKLE